LAVQYLVPALFAHGRRVVVDAGELDDDLARDMAEVLTSL
jgi:predicted site-specific integrase-resolvase